MKLKKNKILKIILITLIVLTALISLIVMLYFANEDKVLDKIHEYYGEEDPVASQIEDLGYIICDEIDLNAPIKEGISLAILDEAVGHFDNTAIYSGNVCLAAHNYGENKDFFKDLNKLKAGSEIIYRNLFGDYTYKVEEIKEISEYDLSVLEATKQDQLTLITCISGKKNLRLCLIATRIS